MKIFETTESLIDFLNKDPKTSKGEIVKIAEIEEYEDKSEHIPIGIQQTMLNKICLWDWHNESIVMDGKNVTISGRITCRFFVKDGNVQRTVEIVKSGVGAANYKGDINSAAPIAESFAFKNATKKLGKLFGGDLNRDETMAYKEKKALN